MDKESPETPSKRTSPPRRRKRKSDPAEAAEELRCNIAELQELLRRVLAMADGDLELGELLKVLDTAGSACSRIGRLLKMDPAQSGMDTTEALSRSMDEAIAAIRAERGWR